MERDPDGGRAVVTVDITADLNDEDESGFAGSRACLAGSSRRRW